MVLCKFVLRDVCWYLDRKEKIATSKHEKNVLQRMEKKVCPLFFSMPFVIFFLGKKWQRITHTHTNIGIYGEGKPESVLASTYVISNTIVLASMDGIGRVSGGFHLF